MGISPFARPTASANARSLLVLPLRELEWRVCEHRDGLAPVGQLEDRQRAVAEVLIPELDAPDDDRIRRKRRNMRRPVAGTNDRGALVAPRGRQTVVRAAS